MATNDVFVAEFAGNYASVPFSFKLAYIQYRELDDAVTPEGEQFLTTWFDVGIQSPWAALRQCVTDKFTIECATVQWGQQAFTAFPTGADGTLAFEGLPATHNYQIEVPPFWTNNLKRAGRFFVPGIPVSYVQGTTFSETCNDSLVTFAVDALTIDDPGDPGTDAWRLMPHEDFLSPDPPEALRQEIWADRPYHSPHPKRLKGRQADACAAFLSGGLGGAPTIPAS